jgi:hypothetical protein
MAQSKFDKANDWNNAAPGERASTGGDASRLRHCDDAAILKDCRFDTFRASGPGGQKRNKTSSAVRIVHTPSGIAAIANESRSQHTNRAKALLRLRHKLALQLRDQAPVDRAELPSWFIALTAEGNLHLSQKHEHYLPAMGLVLDLLAAEGWAIAEAAAQARLSTAALVRFLEADTHLWAYVNTMRGTAGLKPLR